MPGQAVDISRPWIVGRARERRDDGRRDVDRADQTGRVIDVQGAHEMGEWLDDWAVHEPNAEAFDMSPALYEHVERKYKDDPEPVVDKILAGLSA